MQKQPQERKWTTGNVWSLPGTLEFARQFAPDVPGCKLEWDLTLHFRWKCTYPTVDPPHMVTKAWNDEVSTLEALKEVLWKIWRWHFLATGQKCPFEIDALPEIVWT